MELYNYIQKIQKQDIAREYRMWEESEVDVKHLNNKSDTFTLQHKIFSAYGGVTIILSFLLGENGSKFAT